MSITENHFSYFSTKTYVVGPQKNRLIEMVLLGTLIETVLLSTQNTIFTSEGFVVCTFRQTLRLTTFKIYY